MYYFYYMTEHPQITQKCVGGIIMETRRFRALSLTDDEQQAKEYVFRQEND